MSELDRGALEDLALARMLVERGIAKQTGAAVEDRVETASLAPAHLSEAMARRLPFPGETFAGWTIKREIGRGAMGAVFLARRGSEAVALKVMARVGPDEFRLRFAREARTLFRMRHPNVVAVRDVGDEQGVLWIAMEYVEGLPLSRLAAHGLPLARALEICEGIAYALEHAHAQGIVHRDLKPDNVLVTATGGVKVVDFGLAKDLRTQSSLTREGDVLGTPHYLAPESVRGEPDLVTAAADIYAVGVILYELATGSLPFAAHVGAGLKAMLRAVAGGEVEPPSRRTPGLPPAFDALVLRALDRRLDHRYPSATALARDLALLRRGEPLTPAASVTASASRGPGGDLKVGEFSVLEVVGRGGSGVVHRGRGPDGRDVAIKFLLNTDENHTTRFERERRILALLGEQEGFVPLLGSGTSPRGPYVVMPYVAGGSLGERLRQGLSFDEALSTVRSIVAAMARAHGLGIIHRDLKPDNVLFTAEGTPLVADLGLAKQVSVGPPGPGRSVLLSRSGEFRGTLGYIPVEQMLDARSATPAADVFALGAIAYECLAGESPFEGGTGLAIIASVEAGSFEPLERRKPGTPRWLARAVDRALSRDPLQRFHDAAALALALDGPRGRVTSPGRARPRAIAAVVAAVCVVFGAFALGHRKPDPLPPISSGTDAGGKARFPVAVPADVGRLLRGKGTPSDLAGLASLPPPELAQLARAAVILPLGPVQSAFAANRCHDLEVLEAIAAVATTTDPRQRLEAARRLRDLRPEGLASSLASAVLTVGRFVETLEAQRGAMAPLRGDSLAHVFDAFARRPDLVGIAVAALVPLARRDLVSILSKLETRLLDSTLKETPALGAAFEHLPPELAIAYARVLPEPVISDLRERRRATLRACARSLVDRDPLIAAIGYETTLARSDTHDEDARLCTRLIEGVLASPAGDHDRTAAFACGRQVAHGLTTSRTVAASAEENTDIAARILEEAERSAEMALAWGIGAHLDETVEADSHVLAAIRLALGSTRPEPSGMRLATDDPLALLLQTPLPSARTVEVETSRFLGNDSAKRGVPLVASAYALRARARALLGDAAGSREDTTHLYRKGENGSAERHVLTPSAYPVVRAAERLLRQ